jgi:hypothetical protein
MQQRKGATAGRAGRLSVEFPCQTLKTVHKIPVHQIDELRFVLRVNIESR